MGGEELKDGTLEAVRRKLPEEQLMLRLADFFSVFGDSTRMQIIAALRHREMNVGEIAAVVNLSVSAVSHQLKTLRQKDLVRTKREGKYIYYRLSDEHVISIYDMGWNHLTERVKFRHEKNV